jgi:hypothetical protein
LSAHSNCLYETKEVQYAKKADTSGGSAEEEPNLEGG